jgi:hypothetical protein
VVSQEKTSDYYTQPVNQSTKATDRVAFSDW